MTNLILIAALLVGTHIYSQNTVTPCSTMEHMEEMLHEHPEWQIEKLQFEEKINHLAKNYNSVRTETRVIPVVFHVIHEGGIENISREQIQDQIRILNEDFSRTNPDAENTPEPFALVAGVADIEFRLANYDPWGNCSEGIVRLESPLTNNATDDVKGVSYWDSDMYLNVWVVKSIESDPGGTTLGYAQFPGWGAGSTDGVVIRHDVIGSIGTAGSSGLGLMSQGRTATHEVGHWLGLRHIWGDTECGNDWVDDTPTAVGANAGCPSFPHGVGTCSGNGTNGEMFMNYMDYSNGSCQNMFSSDQCDRMNLVMDQSRDELWSEENLIATGTDDLIYEDCTPIADFTVEDQMICEGDEVSFTDNSWNGVPNEYNWSFEGGTPETSTEQYPAVAYMNAGIYSVSMNVSNSAGSDEVGQESIIYVSPAEAQYSDWQFSEPFESELQIDNDWIFQNDEDNGWEYTTDAAFTGAGSMKIQNRSGNAEGSTDALISPSVDMTTIGGAPKLFFDYAYRKMGTASEDRLKVYVSSDCGKTWALRYNRSADLLATVDPSTANFVPVVDQWSTASVPLSSYSSYENLRVKFEFIAGGGNNFWLDNINISDPNSLEDRQLNNLQVHPNPSNGDFNVSFDLEKNSDVSIEVLNSTGQTVGKKLSQSMGVGRFTLRFNDYGLTNGMYMVRTTVNGVVYTKKLLIL